ncbi:precorrin-8X methylmutase [Humidesulfovibrio mexicanus]|uniref:Precorrin-8X methylmutase n=1 Tax=Humidesulfovibrio mexicanus TaxID=147047 RepID=A0A238Z3Z2_9BACT|nr:precorrin-8X methylmutase [Humidesulfovibrio mexicanus]SNR77584.1 precorrin-8X methylmutase [Humidesulfovibrio mexicanus]
MSGVRDIRRGEDIEAESMRIIESEVPEPWPFAGAQWLVVRRMIHTTADFEMLDLARFHPDAVEAGLAALSRGCGIFTDTEMARAGIPARRTDLLGCTVRCLMRDPDVLALSQAAGSTRARAAIDFAVSDIRPEIYVIGNAPTALLRLLEHVEAGRATPALIVGMPVGFVNAAESKDLLLRQSRVPFITVAGRKGGSALAASAVNALADIVLQQRKEGSCALG